MESSIRAGYNQYLPKCLLSILLIYLSVWLKTEAASHNDLFFSPNVTLPENEFDDTLSNGVLALRGSRSKNSIRTSSRDRDLLNYDKLWRAHITDHSRVQSKIEVLGDVLKRHVSKLRHVENGEVELVFLVDSSASVGLENFFNELKFVKKLLADFTVAMWATRVAVITFSSSHRVVANVDQISAPNPDKHKCSLLNEELPTVTYVGGGTYTKGALELAETVLSYARPDSTKAVFLVTDGYSNGGNPLPHAEALKQNEVEVFTFGIRDGNVQELLSMSSEPSNEHCYIVDNFTEFEALARRALHEDLQVGDFILESNVRCSSLCPEQDQCCDVTATCRCGTHTGQYECVCPPGLYGNGLRGGCQPCPSGTYKPEALPGGVSTCHTCPDPNHITPLGSTSIEECRCNTGFKTIAHGRCEEIRCAPLQPPSNGMFVSGECTNMVNSACAMRCNPGYELTGSTIRLCSNETGEWTGQETRCPVKTCRPLPKPSHGVIDCKPSDLSVASICSIQCDVGYTVLGSRSRRCLPIAQWNGLPNGCRTMMCPALPSLVYGFYTYGNCTSQKQSFGTVCRARCVQGFRLEGATTRQCLASGKWEETPETRCIDVTPPIITCPEDIIVDAAPNDNTRNVTWDLPKVGDNCGKEPAVTVIPAIKSPWLIRIGHVTLKYIATDDAGNRAHCKFTITVLDTQPPVIDRCRSPDVILTSDSETEVTWEVPQFSDNSGNPVIVFKSHEPGMMAPLGITEVEYLAMDDAGNTKRCLIYINVQQSPCIVPEEPASGSISCVSSHNGIDCTVSCDRGYGFAIAPSTVYHCDNNGIWYPRQQLPWVDCSEQNVASAGVKALQFVLETDQCNQEVTSQIETSWTQQLRPKIITYCTQSVKCRLEAISAKCNNRGVSVFLDGAEKYDAPQPLKQALNSRTDVSTTDVMYSEFKQNSAPNIVVDLNVTGYIKPGRGDTTSQPEIIQQHLLNSLSSIPSAIFDDLSSGDLDVGLNTQREGGRPVDNMVSVTHSPSQLVCQPGAALINGTQCVQCSRGMLYNSVTKQCERCPTGTYQDNTGQFECKTCPIGSSTVMTSAKSMQDCKGLCSPGSYSGTGLEQCEGCPRGTYQPHRGMTECIECPKGTSTHKTGSTTDRECAVPCGPGYISRSGFIPCLPCPDGYFQPTDGAMACIQCPREAMTGNKGATSITQCQGLDESDYKSPNVTSLPSVFYNDCLSSPCLYDGECDSVPSGYVCTCKPGFTGANCEIDINECEGGVCLNNATCIDQVNSFTCACPTGFQGDTCSIDLDECISQPCQHNSSCLDGPNNYQCVCSKGYQGTDCDVEEDECDSNPCHNGGKCIDFIGGYLCACLNGFHGDQCDEEVNECLSQPCLNNATCHDHPGYFSCTCPAGFEGTQCEVNIDECTSNPCKADGQCEDDINGFICHCLPGYSGKMCGIELPWNFSLVFEHSGTTDYVLLEKVLPDLRDVSISFWMQTTDSSNYGCPFSYANSLNIDNALTLMDYTGFVLYINGQAVVTDVTANDGLWHHIVVTWSNLEGEWHIFKDGEEEASGQDLAAGTLIQGEGVFVIGQEQDIPGGDFNLVESFLGEITLLNVWDRVLEKTEVRALHKSCGKQSDVIKAWPDFLGGITGRVVKVDNHFCQGCFPPLPPRNGNFTGYRPNVTLSTVTYSCNTGFNLMKGPMQAVCQISGEWMPSNLPYCQRVLCGNPGRISNGRVYVDTYMYGDVVTYRCNTNYTLQGPRIRQCQSSRQWSGYQPVCKKTSCRIPEILNANIFGDIPNEGAVYPGTSVQYTCLQGYELTGRSNVTCKPSGRWTSLPKCNPVGCPRPRVITNGYIQAAESLTVGNSITYYCTGGYELIGESHRQCLGTGEWGGVEPRCEAISCGQPPTVEHAFIGGLVYTFGQSVSYMCDMGYVQIGTLTITCTETGMWSPEPPTCIPVSCPPLPVLHHGMVIGQQFFFGKSVEIECDFGYVLRGSSELACTAYGRWSAPPPLCVPVSCGKPDTIEHGNYYGNQFHLGDTVRYICRSGYNLIGEKQRTCEGNQQWSGASPRCEPVNCPHPPSVVNGRLSQSTEGSFTYGIIVVYQCVEGYQMRSDEGIIICQADGQWSGLLPTCEIISCNTPDDITHGVLIATGFNYMDSVSYECEDGYELLGNALRTCQADGTWSGNESYCQPIVCFDPPIVQHATITGDRYYSRKILYTCEAGYEIVGDIVLKCEASRQWSGQVPVCEPVYCDFPPNVSHSITIGLDFAFNASVSYQCDVGYYLAGNYELKCSEFAMWIGDVPECRPLSCGNPPEILNAVVKGAEFTYSSLIQYQCKPGYKALGSTNLTCSETGDWLGEPTACTPVLCAQPPMVRFSDATGSNYMFGQSISYQCWRGYYIVGSPTMVCSDSGIWAGNVPECRIVSCDLPPYVPNAEVIGSNHTYNSSVYYQCHTGHSLVGNAKLICSEQGHWIGDIPQCTLVHCNEPPLIQHSFIIGDSNSYAKSVSYQCDKGYFHAGNTVLTCSENGDWSGDLPVCRPVLCAPPPLVQNSYVTGSDLTFNKTIVYSCNKGHILAGNPILKCSQNAEWIGDLPVCKPITCEAPPEIIHGRFTVEHLTFNSNATYTCAPGYVLTRNTALYCSENATWSGTLPRCEPLTCGPPPTVFHGSFTETDYTYNKTISYECVHGYELANKSDAFITCTADGVWAGDIPKCRPLSCNAPQHLDHGYYIGDTLKYDSTIQFKCNLGYELHGSNQATCSGDGGWRFESFPPYCIPIQCGAPPKVLYATWNETETVFNATVTYTCIEGYWMDGTAQVVCKLDRAWHGRLPECLPVICDVPLTPKNGGFTGSVFTFGNVVEYQCSRGYTLNGKTSRTCQANGTWSSNQPECLPVDCGLPLNMDNAQLILQSGTTLGSTVEHRCKNGYKSKFKTALYCNVDGVWIGDVPPCEPISCGRPPLLKNGDVIGENFLFNNTIKHICDQGYTLYGESWTVCNANGLWTTTEARCIPIKCPDVIIPHNGNINETEFHFSKRVKFHCNEGYNLEGVDVITCTSNGVWSNTEPQCLPVSCGKPQEIENGSRTFTGTLLEATAWYDCHLGYTLQGVAVQHCLANGIWSGEIPTCNRVSCGVPEILQNGSVAREEMFYGDSVIYACDDGFILIGQAGTSCQADGMLSTAKPVCQIVSCGTPPQVKNGRVQYVEDTYTSVAVYLCNDGYNLIGEGDNEVRCLSNGSWCRLIPKCEPVSCGNPDGIENGFYILENELVTYMEIVRYFCDDGFDLMGSNSRICLANATWSSDTPICEPVSCGSPPGLLNGHVNSSGEIYGSVATYRCSHGYDFIGDAMRTCLGNKTWSYSSQSCTPVWCGEPESIPHSNNEGLNWRLNGVVRYICHSGYKMKGSGTIVCQADGLWSSNSPVCVPVECSLPDDPWNGYALTNGTLQYQSVIQYHCNEGYEIVGDAVQTCLEDADWSGILPQCLPVSCGEPPPVEHGSVLAPINVTFGSVVRYTCDIGYDLINTDYIQCQANGKWSTSRPGCEPITCNYPETPVDGNVNVEEITYNSEAIYTCRQGFNLVGNKIQRCMPDQTWSGRVPRCEPIVCGPPPSIKQALWSSDSNDISEHFLYGMSVGYTCIEGYALLHDTGNVAENVADKVANNVAVCGADGIWNITKIICEIISCSVPSRIPNGQYYGTEFTYRSIITYQCNKGYAIIGSATASCNADGQWSKPPPRCEVITCPVLNAPLHGSVSGGYMYNDLLTFECQASYELNGINQIQCTENGTWNHPAPVCKHKSCGRPPRLSNGVMFGQRYHRGDVVNYRCYSGFVLEGSRSRICLENNTWSGDPPECLGLDSFAAVNKHPVCILPCLHGGTCVGAYQCSCPYGYAGYRCEQVVCANHCIGGAKCSGRHSQCPCPSDSTTPQCIRQRR